MYRDWRGRRLDCGGWGGIDLVGEAQKSPERAPRVEA